MRKYRAKIKYTMDENHPDKDFVFGGWDKDRIMEYRDVYTYDDTYDDEPEENLMEYIKRDLKLIAGGGYNTDHIHNVKIEIERLA